jgi:hypothetical protein
MARGLISIGIDHNMTFSVIVLSEISIPNSLNKFSELQIQLWDVGFIASFARI